MQPEYDENKSKKFGTEKDSEQNAINQIQNGRERQFEHTLVALGVTSIAAAAAVGRAWRDKTE